MSAEPILAPENELLDASPNDNELDDPARGEDAYQYLKALDEPSPEEVVNAVDDFARDGAIHRAEDELRDAGPSDADLDNPACTVDAHDYLASNSQRVGNLDAPAAEELALEDNSENGNRSAGIERTRLSKLRPERVNWYLEGLVPKNHHVVLAAPGGTVKGLFSLYLVAHHIPLRLCSRRVLRRGVPRRRRG